MVYLLYNIFSIPVDPVSLPGELSDSYGLTIEVLNGAFGCEGTFSWRLHGIPNVEFYRKLHCFLKNWKTTRCLTKTSIGNFYITIDKQLQERGSSPYNTYRFIQQLVSSDIPDSALMSYGCDKKIGILRAEIRGCNEKVQDLDIKVIEEQDKVRDLVIKVKEQEVEMSQMKAALRDILVTC